MGRQQHRRPTRRGAHLCRGSGHRRESGRPQARPVRIYVGGPASIPKLYNGKDKTFFSFGWENYRESSPAPGFRRCRPWQPPGRFLTARLTIYDPLTTRLNPNFDPSRRERHQPAIHPRSVPGNMIPQNRWNPVGAALANAYPAPNNGTGPVQQLSFQPESEPGQVPQLARPRGSQLR